MSASHALTFTQYSGHLSSSRETQRAASGSVTMVKTSVGSMDNNCYFLAAGGQAVLIDAATDADHLLAVADALGATITDVVTTHSHYDHVRALKEVLAATGARHHSSAGDAPDLPVPVDREVADGQAFDLAGDQLSGLGLTGITLHGHTKEGLAVVWSPDTTHLFVGDSLFPGGVGKTNSPQVFSQLLHDVVHKLFDVYPDSAVVHPGHGDDTTLGAERPHLDEWAERGW